MNSLLNIPEQDDAFVARGMAREPVAAPVAGSLLLHGALGGALVLYGILGGFLHHNFWGNPGEGGAIQVNLESSALPLPADQPPNENVLSTETPSQAPEAPSLKETHTVDQTAIPIVGKQVKPKQQTTPKAPPHQLPPTTDNRVKYGDQASTAMPRQVQQSIGSNGPTTISVGDFGSRFGWYVDQINRKMNTSWYKAEVDPRTPKGARVYLTFTIRKDGSPTDVAIDRSSGSNTLDRSCQRGVQRVDSFGILPSAYNPSTLKVSYYCEY